MKAPQPAVAAQAEKQSASVVALTVTMSASHRSTSRSGVPQPAGGAGAGLARPALRRARHTSIAYITPPTPHAASRLRTALQGWRGWWRGRQRRRRSCRRGWHPQVPVRRQRPGLGGARRRQQAASGADLQV